MAHYDCSRCGTALGISPENCPTCLGSVEHTGGSSGYYRVSVPSPTTLTEPYDAECNDIIEALGMTFAEGNVFKALWRTAASRQGKHKKGNNTLYDAEKIVFFANRILLMEQPKCLT